MKYPVTRSAVVTERNLKKAFLYDSNVMLTLDISYPEITLEGNRMAQRRINAYYQDVANQFYHYASDKMLLDAIDNYKMSIINDFPFHAYDAVMKYTVTYNERCHLSTYIDQYQYTGGAHGLTMRTSENWSLQTGRRIRLQDLFGPGEDYTKLIQTQIILQAEKNYQENPGIYFDNYRELIVQYFNPNSFYFTPNGVTFYYQQYEVGPYASGIIEFTIPYAHLGIRPPHCMGVYGE